MLPNDLPPWTAVEQQAKRWLRAGCFEAMARDMRAVVRLLLERAEQPTAAIFDGRTMQSSPESGGQEGYDGYKRKKGSKVHVAVDTLGNLLALTVTSANEQERAQVGELAKQVQAATGQSVELAYGDQRLHRRRTRGSGRRARHPAGGGQTRLGQARFRAPAPALGGRAILCLAGAFSPSFTRLRTPSRHARWPALVSVCLPSARQLVQDQSPKLTTDSGKIIASEILTFNILNGQITGEATRCEHKFAQVRFLHVNGLHSAKACV